MHRRKLLPVCKRGKSEIQDGALIKQFWDQERRNQSKRGMQKESRVGSKKGTKESLGREKGESLKLQKQKSLAIKQDSIFQIKEM